MNKRLNPDEAVAYGATVQAGILSGDAVASMQDILLLDVAPLSLGLATTDETLSGDYMTPLIKRNTKIPIEMTKRFATARDFQSGYSIQILQGEFPDADQNHQVSQF